MTATRVPTAQAPAETPIGDLLTGHATTAPEDIAVTCGNSHRTYGQLEARANQLARAYAGLGVAQGDFVTVVLPNGIEFFEACYATWKLGAVPQPASSRLPAPELQRLLALADPALVVGVPAQAAGQRPSVPAGFEPDAALSDAPLESRISPAWKAPTSGGSTGQPKLIVSGRAGALHPDAMLGKFRLRGSQVQLVPGPLYHNSPFTMAMGGTFLAQHVVILPRFDARTALEAIARYRVNFVNLVPTMMLRMLREIDEHPGQYDLGSVETVFHTAAPCPDWLKLRWIELAGAERIYEVYGGTESQALTGITGAEWLAHRGSVGRPITGEVKVVSEDGEAAPPGVTGEVVMRWTPGTRATYSYIGADARAHGEGWESLGDLGWLDDEGYLYIADRDTDMLLVGGANVYPAEVEAAILQHPAVLSSAVVGLPDGDLGQRVHAVVQVTPAPEEVLTETSLISFAEHCLARYKVPRSIHFVTEPLRDDAGKVRRSAVLARELARLADKDPQK